MTPRSGRCGNGVRHLRVAVAGATEVEAAMSSEAGKDPGVVAALEASRRLERSRRAALNQALLEKRRHCAAQVALSLAEVLCGADGADAAEVVAGA